MGAVIEDVLATKLDLVNLSVYEGKFDRATNKVRVFGREVEIGQAQLVGFAAAGVGVATAAVNFFSRAAIVATEEGANFTRAAGNFKGKFAVSELEEFTQGLEELTGIDAGDIVNSLGLLGTFQMDRSNAEALALPILNAAEALKAQGATAEGIAVAVGKAFQTGETTGLRRSGIIIDDVGFKSASAAERVRILTKALQNQGGEAAAAFRDSLPGSIRALNTEVGNLHESLGELASGPARSVVELLIATTRAATGVVNAFNDAPPVVHAAAAAVGITLAGAMARYTIETGKAVLANNAFAGSLARIAGGGGAAAAAGTAAALGGAGSTVGLGTAIVGGTALAGASRGAFLKNLLLKNKGGAIGIGAAIAGGLALSALPDEGDAGVWKHLGEGALTGGTIGAGLGMLVPGGALIGGGIGALVGGGLALSEEMKDKPAGGAGSESSRLVQLMEEQNSILRGMRDTQRPSAAVGPLTGSDQMQALTYSRRLAAP
jgi:hypothetical protein